MASLSFQSVAATSLGIVPFGQKTQLKSPGFTGAGAQLFAAQNTEDDDGTADADYDGPHFEPIIPLPDKIDVKTGEEDEEVVFSHRAKLYRFVTDDKQWKERGVGDIKLLRNRQSGKIRVLMRRDQVLKICANHQITTDMKLQPNAGSDRSWVWSTLADFSEQECKAEQLAVKFKSEDFAKQFKEKFEECQDMLKNQTPEKVLQEHQGHEVVKEDLLTKFKAAEGSWECDTCMVRNDSENVECAACGGLKPGAKPKQDQRIDLNTSFQFSSSAPPSFSVISFGSCTLSTCPGFSSYQTPSSGAGVSFGSSKTSQIDAKPTYSFGSFSQTPNSSSGVPISFDSSEQEGNVSDQTVVIQKVSSNHTPSSGAGFSFRSPKTSQIDAKSTYSVASKGKTPNSRSGVPVSFGTFGQQGKLNEQTVVNTKVSSNQCPSSGAGISFGSPKTSQINPKPRYSFGSISQTPNSSLGAPVSVGSFGQEGNMSEQTIVNPKVSWNQTPSSAVEFSFGSLKAIQIDEKPTYSFGSISQTPNSSLGAPVSVGFFGQEGNMSEKTLLNKKLSSNQTPSSAAEFSFVSPKAIQIDAQPTYSFGSISQTRNSSLGAPVSVGFFGQEGNVSEQRVVNPKVSSNQTPSSAAEVSFGSPKASQIDAKPTYSFGSISQTPNLSSGAPISFASFGKKGELNEQTVVKTKVSSNQCPSSGAGNLFGSPKTSQINATASFSIGSISQTPNSSLGAAVSAGSFGQEGNVSEQTIVNPKVSSNQTPSSAAEVSFGSPKVSQIDAKPTYSFGSISQTPNLSSGAPISFAYFGQEGELNEQTVVNTKVSSNQCPSSGAGNLFGSPKTSQINATPSFSFGSISQTPNSSLGAPVSVGSFGQEGNVSEQTIVNPKVSSNQTPSSAAEVSFGSPKASQIDAKPTYSFGSISQTPNLSSGAPISFASFGQEGKLNEQTVVNTKVSSNQCPASGAGIAFGSPKKSQINATSSFSFGSVSQTPNSSLGAPVSVGSFGQEGNVSEQTIVNPKVSSNQTPSSAAEFSFGSPKASQIDAKPTYSFGSISQRPNLSLGAPISFASFGQEGKLNEQTVVNTKVSSNQCPSSGAGISFGSPKTSQINATPSFGSISETPNSSLGAPVSVGFFGQEGNVSEQRVVNPKVSSNQSPSSAAAFSFGTPKASQMVVKPTYSLRSISQTPNSSSGATISFASFGREGKLNEQTVVNTKVSSNQCPSSGGGNLFGSPKTSQINATPSFCFGSISQTPNSSLGAPVSVGSFGQEGNVSEQTIVNPKVSSNQTPSSAAEVSFGSPKASQIDAKPTYSFGSISQTPNLSSGAPISFASFGQEGKLNEQTVVNTKVSSNQCPSSGAGISFGSPKTSQINATPSFGSMSETPNSSLGAPVSVGFFGQEGNVSEQRVVNPKVSSNQSPSSAAAFSFGTPKASQMDVKPTYSFGSISQTPNSSSGATISLASFGQEGKLNEQTVVNTKVSSNQCPSSGAGNLFGSPKTSQINATPSFSFGSISQTRNSSLGAPVSVGSFGQEGNVSEQTIVNPKVSSNQTPSSAAEVSFGSPKASQIDAKPTYSFGSISQTPNLSSGAPMSFASFGQEGKLNEQTVVNTKVSSNQCPSFGAGISFGSPKTSQINATLSFSFGSIGQTPNSSLGAAVSVGSFGQEGNVSEQTIVIPKVSSNQTPSSAADVSFGSPKASQIDAKPTYSFGSISQRPNLSSGAPISFASFGHEGKLNEQTVVNTKVSSNQCLSSGAGISLGSPKTSQIDATPSFGSISETPNSSLGAPVSVGFFGQEGNVSEQRLVNPKVSSNQSPSSAAAFSFGTPKASQMDVKLTYSFGSISQTPNSSSGATISLASFGQEGKLNEQTVVNTKVSSNQCPSSGAGNLFGSPKTSQINATPSFSFGSISQTPNSSLGAPASVGSFGQEGNVSEQTIVNPKVSSNQTPSSAAEVSFGSPKASQIDAKPTYSFGSISQTPNLSSGAPISFASFGQEGKLNEQTVVNTKVSSNQCPSSGAGISFGSPKTSQINATPSFSSGSIGQTPNSSLGAAVSVGSFGQEGNVSEQTIVNPKVSSNQTPSSAAEFSFGSPKASQIDAKPTYSFGSISQRPNLSSGAPISFASFGQEGKLNEQTVVNTKVSSNQCPSSGAGISFGSPKTSQINATPSFGSISETPNSSLGAPVTVGFFGQEGNVSEQREVNPKVSSNQTPSSAAEVSFGSPKASQIDAKPTYSFGSISQTPNLSSGAPISFASFGQEGELNEQTVVNTKVSSNQCPSSGAGNLFGSPKTSQINATASFSFGSISQTPNSSLGAAVSVGSFEQEGNVCEQTVVNKKVSSNQTPLCGAGFSFGSPDTSQIDAKPSYVFGSIR